jgi:DNA ligase-1
MTTKITKPMLACQKVPNIEMIGYPVLATPKLDGIRCLVIDGKAVSRKFKPIPNDFIRNWIEKNCPTGFDGEIMVKGRNFNDLSGDVRRKDGEPNFRYHVFDYVKDALSTPYQVRIGALQHAVDKDACKPRVIGVIPIRLQNHFELAKFEKKCLEAGYEGAMTRSPNSPYKCGRATLNEEYLLKIKRFEDDEATIVGYEEMMHNDNTATLDAFGRTERSSHQENLRPAGVLGKLVCRSPKWTKDFEIGTGYDAALRKKLWDERNTLKGKLVKFKHQPSGAGERPRFPVFLGFRDDWDV